jgi:WS/DGAT/MGAT family acyltransferase
VRTAERVGALDASFLYAESRTTPMHVGSLAVLEVPESGFDYDLLLSLIAERLGSARRFRQKLRPVPGHLAAPVWVDDDEFDLTYHVRRSALPRPGTMAQLQELVARILSRHLDRHRPLWEMYLVEGLSDGRLAVLSKTHAAMVDGIAGVDLLSLLFDEARAGDGHAPGSRTTWSPRPAPGAPALVANAVVDWVRQPVRLADAARSNVLHGLSSWRRVATAVGDVVGGAVGTIGGVATLANPGPPPVSPLAVEVGQQRRIVTLRTSLEDYRKIRQLHGGTVNDVVLTVVAGAFRTWLLTRGEPVTASSAIRALVPLAVRTQDAARRPDSGIAPAVIDLPIGEASAAVRLQHVRYETASHGASPESVGAAVMTRLDGFAPATLHAMSTRMIAGWGRRRFSTVVANVPGPQHPLFAAGARMLEVYPVIPLTSGTAVTIGVTSYDGALYYGLNGDRDAMPDLEVLAQCLEESLAELLAVARSPVR